MAEIDLNAITKLAESAENRAKELHASYQEAVDDSDLAIARGLLNDCFYWSGKATSYRGVIAMVELQTVIEDELDAEARCP